MAYNNTVTIVGNLTRDPELRYSATGVGYTQFGVAYNRRAPQGSGREDETHFFDVVAFNALAENVAVSLAKGDRVIITGNLNYRAWETENGERRSKISVRAETVGPSLEWAEAAITRNPRDGAPARAPAQGRPAAAPEPEPEPF